MPTSQEDLDKKADTVQKLREEVAAAEADRIQREVDAGNDVTMLQLDAEETRLRAALAAAREAKKVGSIKAGNEAPVAAAKDALAEAVAAQNAPVGPLDGTVPTSTPEPVAAPDGKGK